VNSSDAVEFVHDELHMVAGAPDSLTDTEDSHRAVDSTVSLAVRTLVSHDRASEARSLKLGSLTEEYCRLEGKASAWL